VPERVGSSGLRERVPERRLFIAVLLPPAWISALAGLQQQLRDAGLRLRYVRPEGIHLTLHFLGATPEMRKEALDAALREAAAYSGPFQLRFGAAGTFGTPRRPRVVWTGIEDAEGGLNDLQRSIGNELGAAGFPVEQRPFRPHLTLARVPEGISTADAERLTRAVAELRVPAVAPIEGQHFSLVESHLGASGARYDQLATYGPADRTDRPDRSR
jgi:RNA 2',3'-cyclic 3'-phosphodiesterase